MTPEEITQIITLLTGILEKDETEVTLSQSSIDDLSVAIADQIDDILLNRGVYYEKEIDNVTIYDGINVQSSVIAEDVVSEMNNYLTVNGLVEVDPQTEEKHIVTGSSIEPFIFCALLLYFVITVVHNIFNKFRGIE